MSLVNVGICNNGLNPVTSYKMYKCIVMPRALYGCELWPILNNSSKSMLEKSHRFCLKCIQCISKYTRTDICVSLIGSRNICFEIEQRKLFFLGQLCCLSALHISRSIFLYRIVVFYHD